MNNMENQMLINSYSIVNQLYINGGLNENSIGL